MSMRKSPGVIHAKEPIRSRPARGRYHAACLIAWASAMLVAGCSGGEPRVPVFPAGGKVSFAGEAPRGAFVVLHPSQAKDDKTPLPSAEVKDDGSFTLTTYDGGDGAPAGDYAVTIQWYKLVGKGSEVKAGPNVIPPQYSKPETSPWKVSICSARNELAAHTITK